MLWRSYITYSVRVKYRLGSECIALLFDVWWWSIKKKVQKLQSSESFKVPFTL